MLVKMDGPRVVSIAALGVGVERGRVRPEQRGGAVMKEARENMVCCPRCGGYPELDDWGFAYTCYFCFDRGVVSESQAAEEVRRRSWGEYLIAERAIRERVALGVPDGWTWKYDSCEGIVLIPPRRACAPANYDDWTDDIPF